jgi:hypothetical protein
MISLSFITPKLLKNYVYVNSYTIPTSQEELQYNKYGSNSQTF